MSTSKPRQLKLGSFLTSWGDNAGIWRHPDTPADAPTNLDFVTEIASTAERGKFDFVFVADSAYITRDSTPYFLSRFEPITVLSAVAARTSRIGLVGTMSTSFSEPFTTARQLASLDKLSGGRAGWNAVTSALEGLGRNHGHDALPPHAERYAVAEEYIDVVKGLWDSWDEGAFVRNKATGEYADFERMHVLNHSGRHFKVQGPLNMERSAQGRPIVFQAGQSDEGRNLAALHADAIFSTRYSFEQLQAFSSDIRARLGNKGRNPDHIRILPKITAIIGDTEEAARRLHRDANEYLDIDTAVKYLSRYFSFFDFTRFPLDEPLPDLGDIGSDSFKSTAAELKAVAKQRNFTLRELALYASNPPGDFVGTPEQIADRIAHYFEHRACDGFIVAGDVQPGSLRSFVDQVVPLLQKRGIYRDDYEGDTLREHLDLPKPPTSR